VGFYNKKEFTKAIECFEKSVELDPMNVNIDLSFSLSVSLFLSLFLGFTICFIESTHTPNSYTSSTTRSKSWPERVSP
jgi:tetratricopeptide (TPR) repeat protein